MFYPNSHRKPIEKTDLVLNSANRIRVEELSFTSFWCRWSKVVGSNDRPGAPFLIELLKPFTHVQGERHPGLEAYECGDNVIVLIDRYGTIIGLETALTYCEGLAKAGEKVEDWSTEALLDGLLFAQGHGIDPLLTGRYKHANTMEEAVESTYELLGEYHSLRLCCSLLREAYGNAFRLQRGGYVIDTFAFGPFFLSENTNLIEEHDCGKMRGCSCFHCEDQDYDPDSTIDCRDVDRAHAFIFEDELASWLPSW